MIMERLLVSIFYYPTQLAKSKTYVVEKYVIISILDIPCESKRDQLCSTLNGWNSLLLTLLHCCHMYKI